MTNEDLSKQIQELTKTVTALTETMHTKFEQIDARLEAIDRHFGRIDEQLADIRQDNRTLTDTVKDLELRMDMRFAELQAGQDKLQAGQTEIQSEIANLRHKLFHEEGARETVDESIYQSLDKRLRLVEAKFPDLAKRSAV